MRNSAFKFTSLLFSLGLFAGIQPARLHAASVPLGGYTNDFAIQPPTADWSSVSIAGAAADVTAPSQIDTEVQAIAASTITTATVSDATVPPAFNAIATWSSVGFYMQTRPTGNRVTLLMCTLVNALGSDANAVAVSYDFASAAPNGDEIPGHNVYYSLTGATGSWIPIQSLSVNNTPGRLSANLAINWPNGSTLYLLWADDNSINSPDTANQIDNFSVIATPAVETPAAITSQPQGRNVGELQPVSFTVGVSGNPVPTAQWYTNGVAIPGANSTTYSIAETPLSYNGLQFSAVVQNVTNNVTNSVTSSPATLTVNADTVAPVLLGALPSGLFEVVASFSERLSLASVTNVANYSITGLSGNLTISNATLDVSQTNIIISVSSMTAGTLYTLTVNSVKDLSAAANRVATNSQAQFTAASITTVNIGSPNPPGQVTQVSGGVNITVAGSDIGGSSDQFTFLYQTVAGDFDVKVRVQGLSPSDPWAKATLMAREDVSAGSRNAGSFATPGLSGCFFQYRALAGGVSGSAGSFPVGYPNTWLRLKRTGNLFTGYAGLDGFAWSQLGSVVLSAMPTSLLVGYGVTGHGVQTTAQFRDYDGAVGVSGASTASPILPREPLGPSSRKTSFAITEIMYHPRVVPGFTNNSLEFIEIYNSNPFPESLGNHRLSGAIDFTFPANFSLGGGSFVVVARDPQFLKSTFGITNVVGPWKGTNLAGLSTNGLPGDNGTIRLRNPANAVMLEVNYKGGDPYPVAADGAGHSLVLARASYGEGDPRAWGISATIDGSPGTDDTFASDRLNSVVINEFLAHSDDTNLLDFIELYNHGNTLVDLSGAYLADENDFIRNPAVTNHYYRLPNGTTIPARGFLSFNQNTLGFSLSAAGERIYLVNSNQTRVIDAIKFDAQGNGVSMGRSPDGGASWYRMATRTPGTANSAQLYSPIVINELMIEPISGQSDDEYVELYNRSGAPVNVSNWRFVNGIGYHIPTNTVIPSGGYLVIAKNVNNLFAKYPNLNSSNTRGPYDGSLANGGDRIALAMPETNVTVTTIGSVSVTNVDTLYVTVNEVTYGAGGRWGQWSHGGGSSLELRDPRSDNRLAGNWADSDESAKGIWTTIAITNAISETLGSPINDNLQILLLGVGECLVDDVEVRNGAAGANLITGNPSFETGTATPVSVGTDLGGWTAQGSHDQSTFENIGFTGSRSLHLRAGSRGDNGGNRVRSPVLSAAGTVVLRARAKWVRGWPELLLRLHGGGLEVGGYLPMQPNLGTPGLQNSRFISNMGPAIEQVSHAPLLPAPSEPVTITARAIDPDPITALRVKYRVDPASSYTTVTMTDDGTNGVNGDLVAGDGIFSGRIPGQNANVTVAFYVEAVDGPGATSTFPVEVFPTAPLARMFPYDALTRECVIRWGETNMMGSFATYHVWLTSANTARWNARRPLLNNTPLDGTFVYNNSRVIYNQTPLFAGSPWHRGSMTTGPDGSLRVDFTMNFPEDDKFLGASSAVWNNPGNPSGNTTSDNSAQSEQTTYILFRELGIHYNYRRYMHVFVNGSQRSINGNRTGNFIFEDSQQANGDVIAEWSSDDTDGQLFKIEDWFEFPDNGDDFSTNNDADLTRRIISGGTNINVAAYRFMFRNRSRGTGESANDYTNFINLVNIVSPAGSGINDPLTNQVAQFGAIADYEQWMRSFACQHCAGNWDSYGYRRGKNGYTFKPNNGKFMLWTWDIDFTMGIGGDGTGQDIFDNGGGSPDGDERVGAMWNTPAIRRAYLRAFEDLVNGPLNNSYMDPILDAKAAALVANNVNVDLSTAAGVGTIKSFVSGRRAYLLSTPLAGVVANFFTASVSGATNFSSTSNFVTITGTAPVGAKDIYINGLAVPVIWTSVTNWTARVALSNGVNNLNIQGYTLRGTPTTNPVRTVTIDYTGATTSPVGSVIFNEILYQPAVPDSSFVELFNVSTNIAFDIGGWRINGVDYEFPSGTVIGPRQFVVVTKSMPAFAFAFGFGVTPVGEFDGNLDPDGETLSLIKPATTNSPELVIDKLRYENQPPWPTIQPGSDISLQLIDANQDNGRVSNWGINRSLWSYISYTGLIQSNGTSFLIYIPTGTGGDVYIDDLVLVTNNVPEVGPNLLQNGDFESALTGPWTPQGNHINSAISTAFAHSGNSSLHIVATGVGGASSNLRQTLAGFPTNMVCTVSFWFLPSTNAAALTMRTTPGSGFNPPAPYFNMQPRLTPNSPGLVNQFVATRPAYDQVWLNEIQSENPSGITDNVGEREPWIELYNAGPTPVDMSGYYLANNYGTNLTQWQFPAGYTLAPGQFRVVWADGEPGETAGTQAHTSWRAPIGNGNVALTRLVAGQPQITDYLTYTNLRSGLSYGDFPDGQPYSRRVFQTPTGGGTNNSRDINVFVNEWMASNFSFFPDPTDGQYDDWFELYNAGDIAVDLGGYYLTDNLGDPTKFHIPANTHYVIPPGGFLLVWADNDSADNSTNSPDLHVNFSLDAAVGESIGLYAPDGFTPIDTINFGKQTNNISQGRYADGANNIYYMTTPTPGHANVIAAGNTPPVLNSIPDRTIRLGQTVSFTATATDAEAGQTLTFSLSGPVPSGAFINAAGQFQWTPSALQTPSTNTITVVVTDNGPGALSDSDAFIVTVLPPPVAMITSSGGGSSVTIGFDTIPGRSYRLYYKTHITDASWLPLSAPVQAVGNSLTIDDNIGPDAQRFYRVFQVD